MNIEPRLKLERDLLRVLATESPESNDTLRRVESSFEACIGCRPDYDDQGQRDIVNWLILSTKVVVD